MVIVNGGVKKQARYQGGYVGSVRGYEYYGETTPDVDQKFVRPGFGCLEGDQVTAQESPGHPERRGYAEVLAALASPGIETEGAEPLVAGDEHRGYVERGHHGYPQLGAEGLEEG